MGRSDDGTTTDGFPVVGVTQSTRCRVLVVHSRDKDARGRSLLLASDELVIGRSPSAPYVLALDDAAISRSHAILRRDGDEAEWLIADQGSRNGTWVDGERVERTKLDDGAVIRVGGSILLFQVLTVRSDERLEPSRRPLVGTSLALQRVRGAVQLVAPRSLPVLILGESGVGKDVVAEEIHRQSGLAGPFIPVNCGALPDALVESEMFGHAQGAFTGAVKSTPGLFRSADGGTLFLDEIGELPLSSQAKLLRVLDKGEVRPVGGSEVHKVRVRVVAATNVDLTGAISDGRFRGDLFARLSGFVVHIPPFRERREDVLALADEVAEGRQLSPDAAEAMLLHGWPYNAREIQRVVAAAVVSAGTSQTVELFHLPLELRARIEARTPVNRNTSSAMLSADQALLPLLVQRDSAPTRDELIHVLKELKGNIAKAAELYGKDRRQVYRWVERLGVDLESFRDEGEG